MKCGYCNKEIEEILYFCPFCGILTDLGRKPRFDEDEKFLEELKKYKEWYRENCSPHYNGKITEGLDERIYN